MNFETDRGRLAIRTSPESRFDRSHLPVDRAICPSGSLTVTPLLEVVASAGLHLKAGERVFIHVLLEAPLGTIGRAVPTLAPKVSQVGFQCCSDRCALDHTHRRARHSLEPCLGQLLGLVELETLSERVVLLSTVPPAIPGHPGTRTPTKSQVLTFCETLPVRLGDRGSVCVRDPFGESFRTERYGNTKRS